MTDLKKCWVGLFVFGACSACSTAKMQVPPDIAASSEVIEATDRSAWSGALADESFKLGVYAVADVDRDWNSSSGFSIANFSKETTTTGYQFGFEGAGVKLAGKCASSQRDNEISLGSLGLEFQFNKLGCTCGDRANVVVESKDNEFYGTLSTARGTYQVKSIQEVEGGLSSGSPSGYRVDSEESPIGATEVLRPGRVFLSKRLASAEKAELTCLFAGLMLYLPPKDD